MESNKSYFLFFKEKKQISIEHFNNKFFLLTINKILNIIFPPSCVFCGKICMENEGFLCIDCINIFEKYKLKNRIRRVKEDNKNYYEEMYLYEYKDVVRKFILGYKFNDKSYMYKGFVRLILNDKKIYKKIFSYDIITSVPIHSKRKKLRGYNQSKLIAKEIANIIGIDYKDLVEKVINNNSQSELNKENRIKNVKDVYKVKNSIFLDKKILIIDDIYTTGSTLNEVAKELLKITKKENIGILTIAKD